MPIAFFWIFDKRKIPTKKGSRMFGVVELLQRMVRGPSDRLT